MSKTIKRNDDEKKYLTTRLKTIEGQIRGITNMIEQDRNCQDILIQMSAISKSLKSLSQDILKEYLSNCAIDRIQNNSTLAIEEIMDLIRKLD